MNKTYFPFHIDKDCVIIVNQDNEHVEQLVRSWDTDETTEEFENRINHRVEYLKVDIF